MFHDDIDRMFQVFCPALSKFHQLIRIFKYFLVNLSQSESITWCIRDLILPSRSSLDFYTKVTLISSNVVLLSLTLKFGKSTKQFCVPSHS